MQTFEIAVNDDRAWYHNYMCKGKDHEELRRLTRRKFKGLFLKKSDRSSKEEQKHIKDVLKENEYSVYLELIKEGKFEKYNSNSA